MAKPLLITTQYEAFDMSPLQPSSPPEICYGCLQHIISVEFREGNYDLGLPRGTTFSFALFHRCMLTQKDPQLDRLNIQFYSEEDTSLQITDISRVRSLIGRIRDGSDSWAIIDRYEDFSREAYLTHENN